MVLLSGIDNKIVLQGRNVDALSVMLRAFLHRKEDIWKIIRRKNFI